MCGLVLMMTAVPTVSNIVFQPVALGKSVYLDFTPAITYSDPWASLKVIVATQPSSLGTLVDTAGHALPADTSPGPGLVTIRFK